MCQPFSANNFAGLINMQYKLSVKPCIYLIYFSFIVIAILIFLPRIGAALGEVTVSPDAEHALPNFR